MLRSIVLRRQSGLSHQSLGSAVSIGTTFGWHNRYTQAGLSRLAVALRASGGSPWAAATGLVPSSSSSAANRPKRKESKAQLAFARTRPGAAGAVFLQG